MWPRYTPRFFTWCESENKFLIGKFIDISYVCAMNSKQNWYHLYYYCQAASFGVGKVV